MNGVRRAILTSMSENKVTDPELVRLYEVAYLVSSALAEDKASTAILPVKDFLASKNVVVSAEELPKFRRLAYPIRVPAPGGKKQTFDSASFGWIRFEAEADTIGEVKKLLVNIHDIIRFLITKAEVAAVLPARSFVGFQHKEHESAVHISPREASTADAAKPSVSAEELDRKIDELAGV